MDLRELGFLPSLMQSVHLSMLLSIDGKLIHAPLPHPSDV